MPRVGKLVRDRIPEIVAAAGQSAPKRVLTADQRLPALMDKLHEEATELSEAQTVEARTEELADVFEVLRAIAAESGLDWSDIDAVAEAKREDRGGFARGYWMEFDQT